MSLKTPIDTIDDDSFIILDSPGTSLKSNGVMDGALDDAQIEDAMNDLLNEGNASSHAHFDLADAPSPASMMAASTIIADDIITKEKRLDELQKNYQEVLEENSTLKDTLKQNNDSLKEQLLVIASCQDDMLKTTMQHREKFVETKALIEKLRQENKKLKQEAAALADVPSLVNVETGELKADPEVPQSGPSSALEFVTSPEDDTVDKLTAQLELVEKQRRQVITDNEKLTWQKESLEHIVDATTKERDDLKDKLKRIELQMSTTATEHEKEKRQLNSVIEEMEAKLKLLNERPQEELAQRNQEIQRLEEKSSAYLAELQAAKLALLKAENIKMRLVDAKRFLNNMSVTYKQVIEDFKYRLRESTTTLWQPVRLSDVPPSTPAEISTLAANVKLYDRALKHLAEVLNNLTHGLSDSLVNIVRIIVSLHDQSYVDSKEEVRGGLEDLKAHLEKQHLIALANVGQVRGTLKIFEGIFNSYKDAVALNSQEKPESNINSLTAALVARGQELQALQEELSEMKISKDDTEHLKAQMEVFRSDFEAERKAREQMAGENNVLQKDLRQASRRYQELAFQMECVRNLNPAVFRIAASKQMPAAGAAGSKPTAPPNGQNYSCPKCRDFTTTQYRLLEDHLDFCLDDF